MVLLSLLRFSFVFCTMRGRWYWSMRQFALLFLCCKLLGCFLMRFMRWSDSTLFESLRRLQLMDFTVDLLKATEIGKAVNSLRKHRSKDISQLARTLINDWKQMVDEWIKATTTPVAGLEGTSEPVNASIVDDEEGLPSPPMDEEALFATQIGSMDLSQFFDGMDDYGNPQQQSGEFIENREDSRRPCLNTQNIAKMKSHAPNEANIVAMDSKSQQEKKNDTAVRLNKPVNSSIVDDEEGLPSPPMDEGALLATQIGSMDLSQFFDGMDDYGNPQQSGEFIKNREDGRRPCLNSQNIAKMKSHTPNEANIVAKDSKSQQEKKNDAAVRLNRPVTADSGPCRSPKPTMQQKGRIEPKTPQNILKGAIPKRPQVGQLDKFTCLDETAIEVKLEATKRKLQERYQQAENAKRQRTAQVIELCDLPDLPKQGVAHRNPLVKSGNHKKLWPHGQR